MVRSNKKVTVIIDADVNDEEVKALDKLIQKLDTEDITVDAETSQASSKIKQIDDELDEVDDEPLKPKIDDTAVQVGISNITAGFQQLKAGIQEIGTQFSEVMGGAGKRQTNETFLAMNIGADNAKKKISEINDIVQKLPGDDTALQGLLSSASAKNANMSAQALENMGSAAADYFAAMSFYGKSATESQQDMTNYILSGNTAELERSPILQGQIDKLKEANSVEERTKALREALNKEGWLGISQQDTYNNKLETFNGMLQRGSDNLGALFLEGSTGFMDLAIQLDDATNGIFGMGLALGQFATPVFDAVSGIGQMATGFKAIKDLGFLQFLKDLEIMTKLSAAADWLLSAAQGVLNAVMDANPIVLIVLALVALAAALIWAYQNVDWFREGVNNLFASFQPLINMLIGVGQALYNVFIGTITQVMSWISSFTEQLGLDSNDWIQSLLGFILFLPQLPLALGVALANSIASVLGFGDNFVGNMLNSAYQGVTGFAGYISQLPGMVYNELQRVLNMISDFISSIPSRIYDMGAAVVDALKSSLGIGSPGYMFYMVEGEFDRIDDLTKKTNFDTGRIGADMVAGFNPNFETSNGNANAMAGNITNVFNIDSVDSEERVKQLAKEIGRLMQMDNVTAGRGV